MKISAISILVFLALVSCTRPNQQPQVHLVGCAPTISLRTVRPEISLPDSLGGPQAHGQIILLATTTFNGKLLDYRIAKIKIAFHGVGPTILYSLFDDITSESATVQRDRYAPWIATYLTMAHFKVTYDTSYYKVLPTDTLQGGITIQLGTK